MRKIVGSIGAVIMIAVFITVFIAHFITNTDPATNIMYDGLGRQLSESPFLMRIIFEQERMWAGWLWLIGDMVIFSGSFVIGVSLANWGFQEPGTKTAEPKKAMEQSGPHKFVIHQVPGVLAVVRLNPSVAAVPSWASTGALSAIVRTSNELTVVCDETAVPEGMQCERGWVALMLEGEFPFTMSGVLSSLLTPLAESGISVFVLSTFSTDCILVKTWEVEKAKHSLEGRGHSFQ